MNRTMRHVAVQQARVEYRERCLTQAGPGYLQEKQPVDAPRDPRHGVNRNRGVVRDIAETGNRASYFSVDASARSRAMKEGWESLRRQLRRETLAGARADFRARTADRSR